MVQNYPYEWVDIPKEEVKAAMPNTTEEYVRSIPGNVWMPVKYRDAAEKIYNFKVRPDDIWIVTFPKCGTTWTQELLWHVVHNVDIERSKVPLFARSPFLEFETVVPAGSREMLLGSAPEDKREMIEQINFHSIAYAESIPSPRVIKCHMPLSMLNPDIFTSGCKVVYVCRNPKDTCVSYFHHHSNLYPGYDTAFERFAELFMEGKMDYGSYWYHLKDALKYKDEANLKIVWYEEMKKDLISVIREMSKFLGYHLTELKVLTLDDHLYIDNIRKHGSESMSSGNEMMKEKMSKFFRKGVVGDWKNYFTGDKLKHWDDWIKSNLEGTELEMSFEI